MDPGPPPLAWGQHRDFLNGERRETLPQEGLLLLIKLFETLQNTVNLQEYTIVAAIQIDIDASNNSLVPLLPPAIQDGQG